VRARPCTDTPTQTQATTFHPNPTHLPSHRRRARKAARSMIVHLLSHANPGRRIHRAVTMSPSPSMALVNARFPCQTSVIATARDPFSEPRTVCLLRVTSAPVSPCVSRLASYTWQLVRGRARAESSPGQTVHDGRRDEPSGREGQGADQGGFETEEAPQA
jgi:hypothetical protein